MESDARFYGQRSVYEILENNLSSTQDDQCLKRRLQVNPATKIVNASSSGWVQAGEIVWDFENQIY